VFLNYALGLEYLSEKNFTQAEQQFRKTIFLDENYLGAHYQLGKTLEHLARVHEALEAFNDGLNKAKQQKNRKSQNEFEEAIFLLE